MIRHAKACQQQQYHQLPSPPPSQYDTMQSNMSIPKSSSSEIYSLVS